MSRPAHILLTNHERAEFARFAQAAYSNGHNTTGHRYSAVSAVCLSLPVAKYDSMMADYRAWLIDNEFPEITA